MATGSVKIIYLRTYIKFVVQFRSYQTTVFLNDDFFATNILIFIEKTTLVVKSHNKIKKLIIKNIN